MKKIVIHSIVFSPDGVSTAYLYNDIALKFKESGYNVTVLTTTPHYNIIENELQKQPLKKKALGLYFESTFKGIKVKHVYQKKYTSTILRILGFIYWHIVSFLLGLFEKNVDIILSPSPPLTIGFVNILLAKIKKAKVIYNVQEIYPDLLIEEGGLKSKAVISILKKLEKFVYNNSDAVVTIDKIFYDTIVSRFKDKNKLHIIPNFVDTSLYKPIKEENIDINKELFPSTNSLKVMYAGNIGHAQDWNPLIDICEKVKDENISFFVIGEGVMKSYLKEQKKLKRLSNLHLIAYQPRDKMADLLAYSDVQFIFMNPHVEGHGFPSKVYTIMTCARPLIVCSGENTPIINFLKDKNCSYLITTKDYDEKIEELSSILLNISKDDLRIKGENGLECIAKNYSKDIVTQTYVNIANTILE